ncbi:hypothetical protein PIB30_092205 [Stylosanthes scabra]|uniref:Uncharacterized protein n=1 Tax=Stylosanthes scabra TaxID=79078 RepID=A0ABU6RV20_9FABA|nr:hypothetical protein [Stylosanthes scabra]
MKAKQEEFVSNQANQYNLIRQDHKLLGKEILDVKNQKIVKQIYDNIDHKRPMFRGLLKSDLQPSDPTQPLHHPRTPKILHHHPKTKRTPQNRKNEERKLAEQETKCGSKTEQELHAYAWKYGCYIKSIPRLSNSITVRHGNQAHFFHAQAWKTTHMRSRSSSSHSESRLHIFKRGLHFP